ncbi:cytochrome c oxidase subunit 6A2, mitochondrial-like [Convolutriloba macropyga]|uniref:cytochrome c oxidase subunit 6A2, mitochondrial-like n=1 Tax=Convolutriloba macropyga TaxID=536237 RepID=UPI003F51AE87
MSLVRITVPRVLHTVGKQNALKPKRGMKDININEFVKESLGENSEHHAQSSNFWKAATFFIAIPAMMLGAYNAYRKEAAHHLHSLHEGRPEYKPYPHLGIIRKPFPWGDGKRGLFFNPKKNPVPGEGYVDE